MATNFSNGSREESKGDSNVEGPTASEYPSQDGSSDDSQAGVRRIEAISQTWSRPALLVAYASLYLMAIILSLEIQTTSLLTNFATSAFAQHSLLSTVLVVQNVVNAVIMPPMSKIADVFGRLEAFCFSLLLLTAGYIQQAGSNNVQSFASAQIFYSAGLRGYLLLQQIFIADTSDLLNRALLSSIPDLPFLFTTWVGSPIVESLKDTWRWGYGMWAIIVPVTFLPLSLALFINQRKASKFNLNPPSPFKGVSFLSALRTIWYELDFFGLILLSAAVALILIPLTLAATADGGWANPSIISMIVIGCITLAIFPFWERSKRFAPHAFFPRELLLNRTILAGILIAFFYFMAFYLSVFPYFTSYLMVVHGQSITSAGRITLTFTFASSLASIVVSIIIKYTGHYKYFVVSGACLYLLGLGIMMVYRVQGISIPTIVGCQVIVGVGGGVLNVPTQLGVQASAKHGQVAAATAIFLTILQVGGAVGSAISGAVWTNNLMSKLTNYLPPESASQASEIYGDVTVASTRWAKGTPERDAIDRAYEETMYVLLTIAICAAAPLVPLSLFMKNYRLDKMDQRVKGHVVGNASRNEAGSQHFKRNWPKQALCSFQHFFQRSSTENESNSK